LLARSGRYPQSLKSFGLIWTGEVRLKVEDSGHSCALADSLGYLAVPVLRLPHTSIDFQPPNPKPGIGTPTPLVNITRPEIFGFFKDEIQPEDFNRL
jgi:hypothetical protein